MSRWDRFLKRNREKLRTLLRQRRWHQPRIPADSATLRLFYTIENSQISMPYTDYALGYPHPEEIGNHPNYRRLPFYALSGNLFGLTNETRSDLLNSLPEKTDFCEFVYNHRVKKREQMFHQVSQYKTVSAPGRSCNNTSPIRAETTSQSRNAHDWLGLRLDYAKKFKFSIAHENESFPGYVTEKIVTAFRAGCIPIYWGAPDVVKDFNPKSFINATQLDAQKLMDKIKALDQDEQTYRAMLQEPPILKKETAQYFTHRPFLDR